MTDTTQHSGYLPARDTEAYDGNIFRVHREMHGRVSEPVAALPRQEPEPRPAMTESGFHVIYVQYAMESCQ